MFLQESYMISPYILHDVYKPYQEYWLYLDKNHARFPLHHCQYTFVKSCRILQSLSRILIKIQLIQTPQIYLVKRQQQQQKNKIKNVKLTVGQVNAQKFVLSYSLCFVYEFLSFHPACSSIQISSLFSNFHPFLPLLHLSSPITVCLFLGGTGVGIMILHVKGIGTCIQQDFDTRWEFKTH